MTELNRPLSAAAAPGATASGRIDASIVVCTFRRLALLEACLGSLLTQTNPFGATEVIVVDNCPVATAEAVVRRAVPSLGERGIPLRYVVEEKAGVARARNRGLAEARHPIICFIDDDERAFPGWLEELLRPFADLGAAVDIVSGEVEPDFGAVPRPEWLRDEFLRFFSCKLGWDTKPRFLKGNEWFGEGNCAFRKSLFRNLWFDAALGRKGDALTASEGIVFTKLRREGAAAYFAPDAKVSHYIHPERLSKKWLLRRSLNQGMSDCMAHRSIGSEVSPTDFRVSTGTIAALDVDSLDDDNVLHLCMIYYHVGYALASGMN